MRVRNIILLAALLLTATGCPRNIGGVISGVIKRYDALAPNVKIGDTREQVLKILGPTQEGLDPEYRKTSEQFSRDGHLYQIDYYRSGWQQDGLTTDDEFTPYLFVDERLVAVGWQALYSYRGSSDSTSDLPPEEVKASGTCFAVDSSGLVITSNHVVASAKRITVRLADGSQTSARILQVAEANDLALLRVERNTPSFLSIARPRSVSVGDQVFTIGFPTTTILGSEPKFTEGSVSALSGVGGEASFLQISVPVQPGNSGGPLVNDRGEVVGIIAATAAIEPFLKASGTLPQNVNWAVKAEYAQLLFDPPTLSRTVSSRREARTCVDPGANSIASRIQVTQ